MKLIRTIEHEGTFGQLIVPGLGEFRTVEREWQDNKPFVSCVPDGEYTLLPFDSPKYGFTYLMVNPELNVYAMESDRKKNTDRYLCIFPHKGSYPKDFIGCVGIGDGIVCDDRDRLLVLNTQTTSQRVIEFLRASGDMHKLTISSIMREL